MSFKYIEETLDIVHTLIETNLQAALDIINTEKGGNVVLTAPVAKNYINSEIDAIAGFPFIQFGPNTSDTIIPGGNWDEKDHHIIIKVHNVSTYGDTQECAQRSYTFTRSIEKIIIDNRTISDQVIGIQTNSANYTPMMTDGNTFKQEVWLNVTVKHHGTFS